VAFRVAQSADLGGAGWSSRSRVGGWVMSETEVVSKRDYTLKAIHCMYSRGKKVRGRVEASSRCRRRKKEEEEK